MTSILKNYSILLASKSPRRQFLLNQLELPFEVRIKEIDESFPPDLKAADIAIYLCLKKAGAFKNELRENELLITSDTIVWINGRVLNKPENNDDAFRMLSMLSGKMHEVFTAVCLATKEKTKTFHVRTEVYFKKLDDETIINYIARYKPFDKAGAYGAQECLPDGAEPCSKEEVEFLERLGKTHLNFIRANGKKEDAIVLVDKIEGSYFNVMGFPLRELYSEIQQLIAISGDEHRL